MTSLEKHHPGIPGVKILYTVTVEEVGEYENVNAMADGLARRNKLAKTS